MNSSGLPIFMYHGVDSIPSVITIPPEQFRWQVGWLHQQGYKGISLGALADCMAAGEGLPERSIVLTFDDGYQDLYTEVFPVLEQFGFSATIFLVAGYCGKDNGWPGQPSFIPRLKLLTWTQSDEMARSGIEFGSHTYNHPLLDRLTEAELYDEIVLPKLFLEDRLGRPVTVFAYPYGRSTDRVKDMVQGTYKAACSTRLGMVQPDSDRHALERVEIKYLSPRWIFQQLFHPGFPYYLALRGAGRTVGSAIFSRPWK